MFNVLIIDKDKSYADSLIEVLQKFKLKSFQHFFEISKAFPAIKDTEIVFVNIKNIEIEGYEHILNPKIKSFEEDFRFELWNAILLLSGALRLKDMGKLDNPKTVFEEPHIDNIFYIKALDRLAQLIPSTKFISSTSRNQAELYLNYFKDRISKYCL